MFNFASWNWAAILTWGQVVSLMLTVIFILLQHRGAGLSSSFGGRDEIYLTRRGVEKTVVTLSVFTLLLFIALRVLEFYFGK
jgi:protein translocase SecG subunit